MRVGGVKSMKMQKSNIAYNLTTLRQLNKFSQEVSPSELVFPGRLLQNGKQANQYPIS